MNLPPRKGLETPRPLHAAGPSRREFLTQSALALVALTGRAPGPGITMPPPPDEPLLYVGTYTDNTRSDGIYLVGLDSRTGAVRQVGTARAGANPSFLAIHPNGSVLYAVNEVTTYRDKPGGAVSSFAIDRETGALTFINEQPSDGGAPCYVSVERGGRAVLVANYVGGNVALLPLLPDGALAAPSHVLQHRGKGPHRNQDAAHAHCIMPDASGRFALVADLGIDRVLVYRMDVGRGTLEHVPAGDVVMRAGAGPRHIALHPAMPIVFVANELDSTLAALRFDADRGTLSHAQTLSTLPRDWTGTNSVADVHVASDGRWVYVSNRGHNSIAVFSVALATAALRLEQVVSTQGNWPRNFALDPTGRWLLVANQRSDSIVVFSRDGQSGQLAANGERLAVPSPVCLRFGGPAHL